MIKTFQIHVHTEGYCDIKEISAEAAKLISKSGVQEGHVLFFVSGSTAGITTVEYEPGLIQDLKDFYEKIVPEKSTYHHEKTWHDGNGFSHIRASLLKPSLTVPLICGKLALGVWQQVVLIDFDNGPRDRVITVQIVGE